MFDPVSRILEDRISKNKDMPVTEIPGYSRRELNIEYSKKYRRKNPQKEINRVNEWRKEHLEKVNERSKAWRKRNLEQQRLYMREYMRAYYRKHRGVIKKHATEWQKKNPEKTREYSRRYYHKKIQG